jgi:5-(carboxyamino)imidazole ribonucleotide synthase
MSQLARTMTLDTAPRTGQSKLPSVAILGGGQLARMMAQEGRRMGLTISCIGPDEALPARPFCHQWFDEKCPDVSNRVAAAHHAVTIESDHAELARLQALEAAGARVYPPSSSLALLQDRLAQRLWLRRQGIDQPEFGEVDGKGRGLRELITAFGGNAVVKTRTGGYDGRGQLRVQGGSGIDDAEALAVRSPVVVEEFVSFVKEISVVVGRSVSGTTVSYPVVENIHHRHALLASLCPARVSQQTIHAATKTAQTLAQRLDYVGVLAVEFFVTADGRVLVNEMAPRVHNSGHLTWGACATSQFEQHLRLVLGWEPGAVAPLTPAVMMNLFGDSWDHPAVSWSTIANSPHARLFLYEKKARPFRKIGHLLFTEPTLAAATEHARRLFIESGLANSLPGALEQFDGRGFD